MGMPALMYVAIGGAVGSMGRYVLAEWINRPDSAAFPFGTLAVNIVGSFLLGVWIAFMALAFQGKAKDLHLLLAIGLLGGFTTFSTFSMDAYLLLERGLMTQAAIYILGSVMLSVAAFFGGMWCIKFALG